MSDLLRHISTSCFGASYLLAFGCELARTRWPLPSLRWAALVLGGIGLFTHSVFLAVHHPSPAAAYGATLAVAWVLAVFYLYGSLHAPRRAWAVFVLPMVLGLVALAVFAVSPADKTVVLGDKLWAALHGVLVLLAAVGVSVGCIASVMYLIQSDRLRRKRPPLGRMNLLSLERLEAMNRRAVNAAFPLLTLGLLLGGVLLRQYHGLADNWLSLKVLGTVGLWGVFGVLLYLRYSATVSGRRLAWLTIGTFGLMLAVLLAAHPFANEPRAQASGAPTEGSP
ncbi:MAG: cytochrome c biogenesis protein CcsA [Fimbriiglobus sp.]|jgi:ABC-type transport system involved in cytochrome c biogenesis permease subunit|nr:cytochrome c biogenesis protein CcsA [Fimbriiglobus sp.]